VRNGKYVVPYLARGSVFGDVEFDALRAVLASDETLSCGKQRDLFEEEFASYIGVPYAVSVTNCTVALEMATYLVGLQPGDEVIAATQTYQATIQPLLGLGDITVRFCDIDPDSLNVDPECVRALAGPRTRAIYLVHHGGVCADMDPIMRVAEEHGIIVIEDSAHALGGHYNGRIPGALGHIGCFSFQSYKNISTLGEGGMITVREPRWNEILRRIRAIEPDADFRPRVPAELNGRVWSAGCPGRALGHRGHAPRRHRGADA
jgi:perosamine synthetase